ncbi:hypothetical protein PLICRDRAFT_175711 [Plicaturopsis crispa FD-325 SS-3]|nr:hypothetical protein PLICRDRAFT_175711 [Plicaturopsis crispa FD-325 SS-3]
MALQDSKTLRSHLKTMVKANFKTVRSHPSCVGSGEGKTVGAGGTWISTSDWPQDFKTALPSSYVGSGQGKSVGAGGTSGSLDAFELDLKTSRRCAPIPVVSALVKARPSERAARGSRLRIGLKTSRQRSHPVVSALVKARPSERAARQSSGRLPTSRPQDALPSLFCGLWLRQVRRSGRRVDPNGASRPQDGAPIPIQWVLVKASPSERAAPLAFSAHLWLATSEEALALLLLCI